MKKLVNLQAMPTHRLDGGDETEGDVHGGCGGEYDEDDDDNRVRLEIWGKRAARAGLAGMTNPQSTPLYTDVHIKVQPSVHRRPHYGPSLYTQTSTLWSTPLYTDVHIKVHPSVHRRPH